MSVGTKTKNLEDVYELTPDQQDILNSYKAGKKEFAYESVMFSFQGTMDAALFKTCWEKVIARHTVLRMSFFYQDLEKPLQAVHREVTLPFEILDWTQLSATEREEKLRRALDDDRESNFVLENAPLMRFTLIWETEDTFKFWWRYSHLLMDGWAVALVLGEFMNYYRSYCLENKEPQLMPTRPYREYVAYLKHRDTAREKDFWRRHLQEFIPPQPLRIGTPPLEQSPAVSEYNEVEYCGLAPLVESLGTTVKEFGITHNTLFVGLYQLLLSRYAGNGPDIAIGLEVSDRPPSLAYAQNRVGFFMHILPVRSRIEPETQCVTWFKRLQISIMEILQYSSSSLREIYEWCNIPADTPIIEGILVFENIPMLSDFFTGLDFSITGHEHGHYAPLPLYLMVSPIEGMKLELTYYTRRFSEEGAKDILATLHQMVETFITNPQITIQGMLDCIP